MSINIVSSGAYRVTAFACIALIIQLAPGAARGQHPHPAPPDTTKPVTRDSTRPSAMPSMPGMRMPGDDTVGMAMSMEGTLGISMERMGSGTTWIPDAVSLPARHFMLGAWSVMAHGFAFLQYNAQQGPRGDTQLGSLNWAMLMADRAFAGGRLQLRFMPSLDPWTVGRCGAPLLLQSGETCHGEPLVDRQHPHDLFMELAALYERPLSSNLAMLLYVAPAGEPALGPVAFMHRPSAMDEPQVTLGHHWQDATHISFGVLTAGLFTRRVRLEGSVFNGHEPDERRYNFEPIDLNSYSGRLTINPTVNWSLTGGYGYLHNPELKTPDESMHRLTTSVMHGRAIGEHGQWATTLLYGANRHFGHRWSNSLLAESEAILDERNTVFGRVEYTEKTAHDLQVEDFDDDHKFVIESFSLGYIRELVSHSRPITFGIGVRGTINLIPEALEDRYGSRTPLGGMLFVRVRPNHAPHSSTPGSPARTHDHSTR